MKCIIVKNRSQVLLGPIDWKPFFIQTEFNDLNIPFNVPSTEQGYINVDAVLQSNTGIEIFPVFSDTTPSPANTFYQEYAGPYYSYNDDNTANIFYNVINSSPAYVASKLQNAVADERYKREIAGNTVVIANTTFEIDTSREVRQHYITTHYGMPANSAINFKTKHGRFIKISKNNLAMVINAAFNHVQSQFDWEANVVSQIATAQTIDDLCNIHDSANLSVTV